MSGHLALHGRNRVSHEPVERVAELMTIAALQNQRVDRQRELGIAVPDLRLHVGDVGSCAEHETDVGASERMRRNANSNGRKFALPPDLLGAAKCRSKHATSGGAQTSIVAA